MKLKNYQTKFHVILNVNKIEQHKIQTKTGLMINVTASVRRSLLQS